MNRFRHHLVIALRPFVTALLVMSLLFPAVLGLLATPVLSQEQALLRDIAASLCLDKTGQGGSDRKSGGGHDCQHCILCHVSASSLAREADSSIAPSHATLAQAQSGQHWLVPIPHPLARHTGPPRGPPILV